MKKNQKYLLTGAIFISFFVLAISFSGNRIYYPYSIGTDSIPTSLDPVEEENSATMDIVNQVFEGLYAYNLTEDGKMKPIPCIAASLGTWNENMTELTIPLKQDVTFHDGSLLKASDIKWNFDRIYRFAGLDSNPLLKIYYNNDDYPILNHTEIINENTIKFVLNKPWSLWESILAFPSSYIIKPNENYYESNIKLVNFNDAIGTGPYTITEIQSNTSVTFHHYDKYHYGAANISDIKFVSMPDPEHSTQAQLNHECIHCKTFLSTYLDQAEADPSITIEHAKTTEVSFLQMNCEKIPLDVRKAISYSLNFSAYVQNTFNEENFELHTPVPDGMVYFNSSIDGVPYYNVSYAREILLNSTDGIVIAALLAAGINNTSNETEWNNAATNETPIFEYSFTHYTSTNLQKVKTFLTENLSSIGIKVTDRDVCLQEEWQDWVSNPENRSSMILSLGKWNPTFKDPITMLEPLYKTNATNNLMFVSDLELDVMFTNYYNLTGNAREHLVWDIQEKIVSEIVPSVYLSQQSVLTLFNTEYIKDFSDTLNCYNILSFYSIKAIQGYYIAQIDFAKNFRNIFYLSLIYISGFVLYKLIPYYLKERKSASLH